MLLFVVSMLLCASLIGCGKQKVEEITSNTILPLPSTIDMDNLDNCTLAISLEEGGAYVDEGNSI